MASPHRDLDEVRRIVVNALGSHRARVWLFGSYATGKAGRTSDIDVAVLPLEPLPVGLMGEIRGALEDSEVLRRVDLVDLSDAAEQFRRRVEQEGVLWRD